MDIKTLADGTRPPFRIVRDTLLIIAFGVSSFPAFAQLRVVPAQRTTVGSHPPPRDAGIGRTEAMEPLSLPFWDDFSGPFLGMYPDTLLWESGFTVWVNSGMAVRPLTLNVATFDGLDSAGLAYNPTDVFQRGYTDSLTSLPIDITASADNPVTPTERNSVFLSFYYQWKGNGEAPDTDEDYLEVEFLDADSVWISMLRIEPYNEIRADTFYAAVIPVAGDAFFHEQFRFRLRTYGRQSGPFDTWNVDYVYLNKGRDASDLSFPDRAIATPLGPLFGRFRAMPKRHLHSDAQFSTPHFEIQNMKNALATLNFRTAAEFRHKNTETGEGTSLDVILKDSTAINITNGILLAREHKTIRLDTVPTVSSNTQFPPGMDSTAIRLIVTLKTGDNVPVNPGGPGDYTPNYEPILFTSNDQVSATYVLSDFYAYDDGVAEYSVELLSAGDLAAVAFDVAFNETFPQDTLIAFDVYFPPHGVSSNQTLDFTIYRDDGTGKPGEVWLSVPARRVQAGDLGEFHRFEFIPAILIDAPRFYIGWRSPIEGHAQVGLDMSNDTGDLVYVNTNGSWSQNTTVTGSLMIRPVFGSGAVGENVGIEEPIKFAVYPNPGHGRFIVDGVADELQVLSATGQPVSFQHDDDGRLTIIELRQPPGLYILRYRQGSFIRTEKIILLAQ